MQSVGQECGSEAERKGHELPCHIAWRWTDHEEGGTCSMQRGDEN